MGYGPWGHKELDTTERLTLQLSHIIYIYIYIFIYNIYINFVHHIRKGSFVP